MLSVFVCAKQWQELFGCKILYFTPSSEHELTYFDASFLHDLQTGFHSINFSADWILGNLKYQISPRYTSKATMVRSTVPAEKGSNPLEHQLQPQNAKCTKFIHDSLESPACPNVTVT